LPLIRAEMTPMRSVRGNAEYFAGSSAADELAVPSTARPAAPAVNHSRRVGVSGDSDVFVASLARSLSESIVPLSQSATKATIFIYFTRKGE
jgi:hypothetical protein